MLPSYKLFHSLPIRQEIARAPENWWRDSGAGDKWKMKVPGTSLPAFLTKAGEAAGVYNGNVSHRYSFIFGWMEAEDERMAMNGAEEQEQRLAIIGRGEPASNPGLIATQSEWTWATAQQWGQRMLCRAAAAARKKKKKLFSMQLLSKRLSKKDYFLLREQRSHKKSVRFRFRFFGNYILI